METKHKLDFECAPWEGSLLIKSDFMRFRVGTCEGLWQSTGSSYDILAVTNSSPGNGHFEDVLEWFEHSCRRDFKDLQILEVWNKRLLAHLISKRGFDVVKGTENVIRHFHHGMVPLHALPTGKTHPNKEPVRFGDCIEYEKPKV